MKTKLFTVLFFALLSSMFQTAVAANNCDPSDVKIVISEKKIWFIADEMPVKCLCIKVKDSAGKVVLEKCLNSKTADWSLNVETLPKGDYTLVIGKEKTLKFKR
jgi:hypothetical protein